VNFVVEDGIADVLEYSDIVSISDNGVIVAGTTGNEAQMVRYPTTHIEIGQTVVRKFVVKVKKSTPNLCSKWISLRRQNVQFLWQ
jgi:hypothetical protein